MSQTRVAAIGLALALALASASKASAQADYIWAKYSLNGYGPIDMGYICDNGQLRVAVHGEAKGTLSIALGDDDPKPTSFDGNNAMGPEGYYGQALFEKPVVCDQRGNWPIISINFEGGPTLKIRWQ